MNVASRIEPFSAPGGIAISNKVNDALVRESGYDTKFVGKPKLKEYLGTILQWKSNGVINSHY